MLIEGTLNRYLADINQQAEQMFHRLIEEIARKQGVTEQLKIERPMEWIVFLIFVECPSKNGVSFNIKKY